MANVCQLIVDPPAGGAWNMAVDEALLESVAEAGVPTLRFYQWESPTLSLGYFQRFADRTSHQASLECAMVRRLSGGGAIVHDQELTYSLILPASHPLATDTQALYQTIHQAIVLSLKDLLAVSISAWQAVLCESASADADRAEPFLCFKRRAVGDVLLQSNNNLSAAENHKIVGSAQRRRQGVVLQHGSLLLGRSEFAPELLGLCDLSGVKISPALAASSLQQSFASALGVQLELASISTTNASCARKILKQRYGNNSWLERR